MRVLSELIEEVRFITNKQSVNRFSDDVLIRFFDASQREIQKIIFLSNPEGAPFYNQVMIDIVERQEEYDLPLDIFGYNSIMDVSLTNPNGNGYKTLDKLTIKERKYGFGYFVVNKKIHLSPIPSLTGYSSFIITYMQKLPRLTLDTDISQLPDICESYALRYVEKLIQYTDSSQDINYATVFTNEEKQEIGELFAESSQDPVYPPMTNDIYLD